MDVISFGFRNGRKGRPNGRVHFINFSHQSKETGGRDGISHSSQLERRNAAPSTPSCGREAATTELNFSSPHRPVPRPF
eukprot:scaffold1_cov108-Cylindrotheca_fusiformis.AAC.6